MEIAASTLDFKLIFRGPLRNFALGTAARDTAFVWVVDESFSATRLKIQIDSEDGEAKVEEAESIEQKLSQVCVGKDGSFWGLSESGSVCILLNRLLYVCYFILHIGT